MYLKEFEGEALFKKFGIKVPLFAVLDADDLANREKASKKFEDVFGNVIGKMGTSEFVLKAQLLRGKRGKSGGIIFANKDNLFEKIDELKAKNFGDDDIVQILIVERIAILQELYLSIAIDSFNSCPVLIFSAKGGVDIEEMADENPEDIHKFLIKDVDEFDENEFENFLRGASGLTESKTEKFREISVSLLKLFVNEDAILAEINPLVITKNGDFLAIDSKIIIDDNAVYKHPEHKEITNRGLSDLEIKALNSDLAYVELDGDIAVIGNGAGLVMATLDSVNEKGGRPANFCDIGGGASREMMQKAMELVLAKKSVKALFINIFGGITHCDEVAEGILEYKKREAVSVPIVVRMVGTSGERGRALLEAESISALKLFDEAVKQAVELG